MEKLRGFFGSSWRVVLMRFLGRLHAALPVAIVCCGVYEVLGWNALAAYFRGLLFVIPMAVSYYLADRVPYMWQFLVGMVLLAGLSWLLLGHPGGLALAILLGLLRARNRMSEEPVISYMDKPTYFMLIFFAAAFFISAFNDLHLLQRLSLISGAVYFLICVLYRGVGRLENYLYLNRSMHGMPTGRIQRTAGGAVLLAVVIAAVLMLPLAFSASGDLHLDLPEGNVDRTDLEEIMDTGETMDSNAMGGDVLAQLSQDAPEYHIPKFLSYLFYAAVAVGLFVLLLDALYILFKNFRATYTDSRDVVQYLQDDPSGTDTRQRTEREKRPRLWDRSPNALVRRAYRKAVLRAAQEAPERWLTPEELEAWAGVENPRLHALYEKARYSGQECTNEEVKEARR